jgi:putative membrane protein
MRKYLIGFLILFATASALGHAGESHGDPQEIRPRNWHDLPTTWSAEPFSWATLVISAVLYTVGLRRMWSDREGRGAQRWQAASFAAGWIALFIALVSPVHPWGNVLFSVHMMQHEILMLIAAPLLVLGHPVVVSLKGLPRPWATRLAHVMNTSTLRNITHTLENPLVAWTVHGFALWIWHAPGLFEAAVRNEFVHFLQHASFFGTALLFWWALFNTRRGPSAYGAGVLYLFTTAVHSSLLGALLTFAGSVWYQPYLHTTQSWGLTPLEDQQLGGLVMWIPAGLIYVAAGLVMVVSWLRESERLVVARESQVAVES